MRIAALCLAVGSGLLSGCATLARGAVDNYNFTSSPPGALATTSLGSSCRTPSTLMINRQKDFLVTLALAGYRTQEIEVHTRLASSGVTHAIENVGNAGIGLVVDAATGATLEHDPGQISVDMQPL